MQVRKRVQPPLAQDLGVHSDVATAAGPHLLRILSAPCPHYSRSLSAPLPLHLRSLSATVSAASPQSFRDCFHCISAVFPRLFPLHLRSLFTLFPRYLRTVAAVLRGLLRVCLCRSKTVAETLSDQRLMHAFSYGVIS